MDNHYDLILNKLKVHHRSLLTSYGKLYPVRMDFAYHDDAYQRQYANYNVIMNSVTNLWKNETDGYGINVEKKLTKNALSELAQLSWKKHDPLHALYINSMHTLNQIN